MSYSVLVALLPLAAIQANQAIPENKTSQTPVVQRGQACARVIPVRNAKAKL